jgi:hypothetical protein
MLIQILDDLWLDIWSVTAIKKIDDKSCSLWVTGQAATEGMVLDYPAEEVAEAINDEREKSDQEPEEEDENAEPEGDEEKNQEPNTECDGEAWYRK